KPTFKSSRTSSISTVARGLTGPLSGRIVLAGETPLEDELRRSERDPVAVLEPGPLGRLAVQLGAVGRVEVDDPEGRALLAELGVTARDVRVLELEVALARAAEDDAEIGRASCRE